MGRRLLLLSLLLPGFIACGNPLARPTPPGPGAAEPAEGQGAGPRLVFEPTASADAVSSITRAKVLAGGASAEARVMLVLGGLSSAQLRDLARPVVPTTISSREVSSLAWTIPDREELVVAPLGPLQPGALYTLGLSALGLALPFTVSSEASPTLGRVWPAAGDSTARAAVWCGVDPLPPADLVVSWLPAGLEGEFHLGTGAAILAARCVSWFPRDSAPLAPDAPALSPPALLFSDGSTAALEPVLLWPSSASAPATSSVDCAPTEAPFGKGCAEAEDDRIIVRAPEEELLWTIETAGDPLVHASRPGERFVVRPCPADAHFHLSVLDGRGVVSSSEVLLALTVPRSHVVISEVLANPAGVEATEEWIELFNDGGEPASLEGYSLEDGGGRFLLPEGTLDAGGYALVVPAAYVADDGVDPAPPTGTLLLRVPQLGRSGLSNDGEKLTLRDAQGVLLSQFPAQKTKNGVSVARIPEGALDDDSAAFVQSPNGGSTPGAVNGR